MQCSAYYEQVNVDPSLGVERPVVHREIRHVEAILCQLSSLGCRLTPRQVLLKVAADELLGDRRRPSNSLIELGLRTGAAGFEPAISRLTVSRYDTYKPTICRPLGMTPSVGAGLRPFACRK